MDFKTKLAFALVSASLLSMAALGYFTYLAAADLFLEDSRRRLDVLADTRKNEIDAVFDAWREEVQRLVDRVESNRVTRRHIDTRDARALANIGRILRESKASSSSMRRVVFFDLQGEALLSSETAALELAAAKRSDVPPHAELRRETDGSHSVVMHAALSFESERVARIELAFDAIALDRFIGATPSVGETGETSLLVPARSHSARTETEEGQPFVVSSLAKGAASIREERVDHQDREVIAAALPLAVPGWGLVVEVESAEVRRRADQLVANMRDLGVALAAFSTLGGVLLGLRMGRPIYELKERVDRIRHGEFGLRLDVKGEDEVAYLAQSLNEFIDQLDHSSDLFRLGELRVLVVVPDAGSRQLLGDLLQNWRMRPTLVETGASALGALDGATEADHPVQLVLLDESIADMPATELAEQLRAWPSGPLPIIMLSSKPEGPEAQLLKASGIEHLLAKPVVASHLMEAILEEMGILAEGLTATADAYVKKTTPRKILLVEDNRLMQRVMMDFLENWGHEVRLAENGRVALESSRRERFDLILMDVMMPEMNGLDATAAIRAHERDGTHRTPIVALTAEALAGDRETCLAAGMDDYITKPVDPKGLYALIERFPAREQAPVSDSVSVSDQDEDEDEDEGLVDWDLARSLTNGDDMLLDELIAAFPAACSEQLEDMRTAIEQSDAELLARSAHSLTGVAKIFGASALVEFTFSLESLGREHRLEDANALLEHVDTAFQRLAAALECQAGRGGASRR